MITTVSRTEVTNLSQSGFWLGGPILSRQHSPLAGWQSLPKVIVLVGESRVPPQSNDRICNRDPGPVFQNSYLSSRSWKKQPPAPARTPEQRCQQAVGQPKERPAAQNSVIQNTKFHSRRHGLFSHLFIPTGPAQPLSAENSRRSSTPGSSTSTGRPERNAGFDQDTPRPIARMVRHRLYV